MLTFHSVEKINDLRCRGVIIPDINSVKIGKEISTDKILPGSTLFPFVRINGEKTKIHSGAKIGIYGPVTVKDSWIGKNAIVGSLGPVTLKDVVVGPESILGSGVAENAVFLGKESFVNKFTTGYGFRIRSGSLFEEDSSSAQHTDTKMTILFPWATLGSNINFCDVILAGGTGPDLGYFSEVGSGTIHFNFTIRGDKATASLFGNISQGVFLNKERIFVGGNNSLIGPLKSDFGVMTAADSKLKGTLSKGLNLGKSLSNRLVQYNPKIFFGALEIISKQLNVLGELAALYNWYKQIRIQCIAKTKEQNFVYSAGLKIVELNFEERLFQLNKYISNLQNSIDLNKKSNKLPKKEILEQREIVKKWPLIAKRLDKISNFEISAPEPLIDGILKIQSDKNLNYTSLIRELSKGYQKLGENWLYGISKEVRELLKLQSDG